MRLSAEATVSQSTGEEHRFAPGEVLAQRYRVVRIAGAGGMGVVYEVDDVELHERVALKTLHAGPAANERELARLRREVQLARRVTHPNVCRIYDVGRHEDVVFVTMELLEGDTLSEYSSARGRLPDDEAAAILRQLCAGLQAAHDAGVIHRDFKSGNVMLVRRGSDIRAVITDFGLARTSVPTLDALASQTGGGIAGTPAYMAPEQIEGAELTPAVDIYALGVVAFELITGEMPFMDTSISGLVRRLREPPPSPRVYRPDVAEKWEALIVRCMEREPADRFPNVAAVAHAIDHDGPIPSARRPRSTHSRRNVIIAFAALLVIAIGIGAFVFTRRDPAAPVAAAGNGTRRSVAVVGFRNLSQRPDAAWLSTALVEMLSTELAAAESLRILPGEEIARAKRDLEVPEIETHAAPTLAKIRAATGADFVVGGSYVALPNKSLRLDLRVQRTTGGDTIASFGTAGTEDDLFSLIARAGAELRTRLGADARLAEGLDLRRAVPMNREAARYFAAGVARLRQFDAVGARDALEKAVAADPQFALAYGELSEAYAFLGFDDKAADAARRGVELSANLPRGERLLLDAKYHQRAHRLDQAIDLYRSLVKQFPDDPEHRVRLITALIDNSRGPDALAEVEAMRKLRGANDVDPRVDLLDAWTSEIFADQDRMLAAANRAIAKARAVQNRDVTAEALIMRGLALSTTARTSEALAAFDEAEDLFGVSGNRAGAAKSLRKRSFIFWRRGDLDEARRLNERALKTYREIGQQLGAASAIGGIGVIDNTQGDHSGARARFTEALEIYGRIGDRQNVSWALASIAGTYVMQNELAEGLRRYEESLAVARQIGDVAQIGNVLANLGITYQMNGDLAQAEARLTDALAIFRKKSDKSTAAECESHLGAIAFLKGDLKAARAYNERAMKVRRELGERGAVADNQQALAFIALEENDPTTALAQATTAASEYESEGRTAARARTLTIVAHANAQLGRKAEARAALETARQLLSEVQDPEVELTIELEQARQDGNVGALQKIAARTEKEKLVITNFDARLALAEAELRAGRRDRAVAVAASLAKDASARGYALIARRAVAVR
ncbi:MAG TPA: protein kinase [Thermoanaerobaculia bacterium]|jgi:tetratricopeptide (TPR) repeat protein